MKKIIRIVIILCSIITLGIVIYTFYLFSNRHIELNRKYLNWELNSCIIEIKSDSLYPHDYKTLVFSNGTEMYNDFTYEIRKEFDINDCLIKIKGEYELIVVKESGDSIEIDLFIKKDELPRPGILQQKKTKNDGI